MKLKVIATGSSGNCYLLDDGKEILIIECGVPFKEVKEAIDYQTNRIVGVLSTHEHQDHRKFLHEYARAGITCVEGANIWSVEIPIQRHIRFAKLGNFVIFPFLVPHDVPCYGYQIIHPDMGKLIFVTDAMYIEYTFPEVNHIMVEANYSQDILDENVASDEIPQSLRNRIMKSHMSFDTAKGMVKANKSPHLRNVIMCHLSTRNSDKKRFQEEMQEVAGPYCNVAVAKKGLELEINKYPF